MRCHVATLDGAFGWSCLLSGQDVDRNLVSLRHVLLDLFVLCVLLVEITLSQNCC